FPRLVRFRAFSNARPISWKPSIATAARIPSRLPKWAYKTGWLYEISSDSRRTVTLDHPSSSAIRRAALIICARRACLSRSFRSAIRLAAIDRKYSAARMHPLKGESFPPRPTSYLALLDYLTRRRYAERFSAFSRRSRLCWDHCDRLFLPCIPSANPGRLWSQAASTRCRHSCVATSERNPGRRIWIGRVDPDADYGQPDGRHSSSSFRHHPF